MVNFQGPRINKLYDLRKELGQKPPFHATVLCRTRDVIAGRAVNMIDACQSEGEQKEQVAMVVYYLDPMLPRTRTTIKQASIASRA